MYMIGWAAAGLGGLAVLLAALRLYDLCSGVAVAGLMGLLLVRVSRFGERRREEQARAGNQRTEAAQEPPRPWANLPALPFLLILFGSELLKQQPHRATVAWGLLLGGFASIAVMAALIHRALRRGSAR